MYAHLSILTYETYTTKNAQTLGNQFKHFHKPYNIYQDLTKLFGSFENLTK